MKSFALISFIILNLLLVSFVSAMGSINEETQSHATQTHQIQNDVYEAENADKNGLNHIDESKCDHMCHIASHMMGFISLFTEQPIVDTSITLSIVNESFLSLTLDPPYQPPQALI